MPDESARMKNESNPLNVPEGSVGSVVAPNRIAAFGTTCPDASNACATHGCA